jgi:hypothetical protein
VVLIAAYLLCIQSYRAGLTTDFPTPYPPCGGVALVLVPERVPSVEGEMPTEPPLFPSAELVNEAGVLTIDVDVTIQAALRPPLCTSGFPGGRRRWTVRPLTPAVRVGRPGRLLPMNGAFPDQRRAAGMMLPPNPPAGTRVRIPRRRAFSTQLTTVRGETCRSAAIARA